MKNILLHVSDEPSLEQRLESALSAARLHGAHLRCLQVTPIETFVAMDGLGGVFVMNDLLSAVADRESGLRSRVEAELAREDVSWDFQHATGSVAHTIASHAALADLVVSGRQINDEGEQVGDGTLADIVELSRTPVLVPACSGTLFDPAATVLIGWDRSFEAASTIKASLPLLCQAAAVHVAAVIDEGERDSFPGTAVLEYLSRHGVHAELHELEHRRNISEALVGLSRSVGAATLLIGAYHHSRIGEYWFGGVTRTLLRQCDLHLVMGR
jgi:nucleotide-binding universal stress UspA family protein